MLAIHVPDHLHHRLNAHGGVVVLNHKTGQWHALNATAGLLWQNWRDGTGFEQSVAAVATRHPDVPAERLRSDAAQLAGELVRRGLLEVGPDLLAEGDAATMAEVALPAGEAPGRLASVTAFLVLLTAALLIRAPFRLAYATVRFTRRWCRPETSVTRATKIVTAVERSTRYYPGRAACMEKSLAAVLMAAFAGRCLNWCLGAAPDPYRFHAWVEVGDEPVVAPGDFTQPRQYLRVLTL
ncbi:lasso peptide biosynthesis B2 protein [Actinomadura sp. 7K534]|uniref:lasso peptide biosynthesis B2 protein n=1 Tax=Actinomadura sp. 7K534 TaxID=2530366 RepID=UPI0010540A8B|nr:lasso peptide biosynthesis B2 protein [Actinomadura sp. 7K534]TDB97925.1 lasso peptide biosynthesis B2 protein [Actinomadura sp. 7K534]